MFRVQDEHASAGNPLKHLNGCELWPEDRLPGLQRQQVTAGLHSAKNTGSSSALMRAQHLCHPHVSDPAGVALDLLSAKSKERPPVPCLLASSAGHFHTAPSRKRKGCVASSRVSNDSSAAFLHHQQTSGHTRAAPCTFQKFTVTSCCLLCGLTPRAAVKSFGKMPTSVKFTPILSFSSPCLMSSCKDSFKLKEKNKSPN